MTRVLLFGVFMITLSVACKKKNSVPDPNPNPGPDTTHFDPAVDPPVANTIGFFLDQWQPKSFMPPDFIASGLPVSGGPIIEINPSSIITKVPKSVFGNNANLWMTQIVTEASLMNDIRNLHSGNIIRFPGGSISDVFFWNAPKDVKPANAPDSLVQANGTKVPAGFWYGKNQESWTFSVDNYYSLLQQTGNQGLITINYGYARYGTGSNPVAAAAHLAADWVRFDNGRTKYWEIGNENFGDWEAGYRIDLSKNQDGQTEYVSGQLYGQHFKVFADSMRKAAQETGHTIYIGAVTSESAPLSWWTNTAKNWNSGLFGASGSTPDYYVVHNYYTNYQTNAGVAEILATPSTVTKNMMDYVKQQLTGAGLPIKPIVLNEWNITSQGSMQQVSHINGMHADMVLGEALKNQFGMTSRWDLANDWSNGNDHGMFSQGGEPGVAKWTARPAFYHMYYFQKMIGDRLVTSTVIGNNALYAYASSYSSGEVGAILLNTSANATTVQLKFKNFIPGGRVYWYALTGGTDNGDFSRKVIINGNAPTQVAGGPTNYPDIKAFSALVSAGSTINIPLAARSSVYVVVEKK
ncbi:MAG: alpha-L-arabinofuranosidase [Terrimonas sp.]|nr:alpha-L-arabinofuranosidase [Terrimonas sp.]